MVENPEEADAIIVRSADMHKMTFGPDLQPSQEPVQDTTNIPVQNMPREGIVVFNTPGANANAVKVVIVGMLLSARNIPTAMDWCSTLNENVQPLVEKERGADFAGN